MSSVLSAEEFIAAIWQERRFYHVHSDANDEHSDINEAILKKIASAPTCKKEHSLRRASVAIIRRRGTILFIATLPEN
jgi:hypothetical protein